MAAQASILVSRHLPILEGSEGDGSYYRVQASSTSTMIAPTPMTITYFPPEIFRNCFLSPTLQFVLRGNVQEIAAELGHHLLTEGDIERASALYLLHPINSVLEQLVRRLNIPVEQFKCLGQRIVGRSKPDIVYRVNGRTVLIVEYKHTNSLRDSDWTEGALVTPHRSARDIIASLKRGVKSALFDNATNLVRQASKYSDDCNLVVLFNYQHMIVLDFTPGGRKWHHEQNPVQYYFLHGEGNGLTFRQLLLAVFIHGMKKAGLMDDNGKTLVSWN